MSRVGKSRPHISLFKGGIRDNRYKESLDRLQAPCSANTQAVLTWVERSRRGLYKKEKVRA